MARQLRLFPNQDGLARAIAAFIDSKRATGRAASTLDFYRHELGQYARHCPNWPPTPADVERFLSYKRRTVSDVSVCTAWGALSAWLNWCERHCLLIDNPLEHVDRPRHPVTLPHAAPPSDIARLLATLEGAAVRSEPNAVRDHALFRLAYDTGLRASELGSLRVDDLELEWNEVLVRAGKGRKDRSVFFGRRCAGTLADWLAMHPGGPWLFPSRLRAELRPLTRRGVYHALKRWCKVADISLTVHQIRHSYATHALRAGIDLEHVSRQLGHSSITVTARYLAADNHLRRQAHLDKSPGDQLPAPAVGQV